MDKRKTKTKHAAKTQHAANIQHAAKAQHASKTQHTSNIKQASKAKPGRGKLMLLVLMALLLLAPALASACSLPEALSEIAINENRNRLEPPALDAAEAFSGTGEYFQKWDSYYNDSFGTRDLLIRIKNQLNYSIFNYTPDLFTDSKGNLYYQSVVAREQVACERIEDFTYIMDKHAELAAICDAMGITYVFFYPPQKNTVYRPEGLPVKRPEPIALERFYAACDNDPRLEGHFVNVTETLRAQTRTVFARTDFHWNDFGAALGYGDVVNHLAALEGLAPPFTGDLALSEFEGGGLKGNQLDNLSILTPIYEKVTTAQKATPITSEGPIWDLLPFAIWENKADAPLGTVLIVGTSFTPPALNTWNETNSGICDYFDKVYSVSHGGYEAGFLNLIPDKLDYIIFEVIESGLSKTVNMDALIAEIAASGDFTRKYR